MQNIYVSGSSVLKEGSYGDIDSSGKLTAEGDISAQHIDTSGKFISKGNLVCESLDSSGKTIVEGDMSSKSVNSSGTIEIGGSLYVKDFDSSGKAFINVNHKGDTLDSSGMLTIEGDCEVDSFDSSGHVVINGLLSSDDVDITIGKSSFIKEIGGDRISVSIGRVLPFGFGPKQSGKFLESELIEGNDIYLENVRADVVRGKNVEVGDGCEIGSIEYTDELQINGNAQVKEQIKV